jgi:hypothetical protein
VTDLADFLGSLAAARRDVAREVSGIGQSLASLAANFNFGAANAPAEAIALELSKLRRQARAERSADAIPEADEDDFIIVGAQREEAPADLAIDALLVDEDNLDSPDGPPASEVSSSAEVSGLGEIEEDAPLVELPPGDGGWLLDGDADDRRGDDQVWPIMAIETNEPGFGAIGIPRKQRETGPPVAEEADDELDGYWDGLLARPNTEPEVDPLAVLMQETVEQELRKQELGKVPARPANPPGAGRQSQTDEEWSTLQRGLPKRRRGRVPPGAPEPA